MEKQINPENLAYWYFRLNGCLCTQNFLIHNRPGKDGTDADLLAVRFPYRRELAHTNEPMRDADIFENCKKIHLMIVEVKTGKCALNGPWTDPQKENIQKALHAVGAFPEPKILQVTKQLYDKQPYEDQSFLCELVALGSFKNEELTEVIQITWEDVAKFIFMRFSQYMNYKTQHFQWDQTGRLLYRLVEKNIHDEEEFLNEVFSILGVKRLGKIA